MKRFSFLLKLAALVLWLVVCPRLAGAQNYDPAAAEALFQKGRAALAEEDYDLACQMFEESFGLDPAVGTVMNLAACEEKRGRLARAWERWHQAIDLLAPDDDRAGYAVMQMESIENRLAHLTIVLEKSAPAGLEIYRDEVPLGVASLGQELPVDPGIHEVTVKSPGHEIRRYTVSLESGERGELVVGPGPPLSPPSETGVWSRTTRQTAGFVALGVGAAGLGLAITTGVLLPGQHDKVEQNCPSKVCNEDGRQAISSAQTLLTLNTIGWIATGVGAASGLALLLTLPQKSSDSGDTAQASHGLTGSSKRAPNSAKALGVAMTPTGVQVFGSF